MHLETAILWGDPVGRFRLYVDSSSWSGPRPPDVTCRCTHPPRWFREGWTAAQTPSEHPSSEIAWKAKSFHPSGVRPLQGSWNWLPQAALV